MSSLASKIINFNFSFFPKILEFTKSNVLKNRQEDIIDIAHGKSNIPYLNSLREEYQIKLNKIKNKYHKKIIDSTGQEKIELINTAIQKEMKVYEEYIQKVNLYIYGTQKRKELDEFEKQSISDEIVFCIDTSWSMYDLLGSWKKEKKIIYDALRDIYSIVNLLDMDKARVSVVSFGQNATVVVPLTSARTYMYLKMVSLIPSHGFAKVTAWALQYDRYNHDDASKGIRESVSVLLNSDNTDTNKSIIYFTDEQFGGVDRAATEKAKTEQEKFLNNMKTKFIKECNSTLKLGINIFTYEDNPKEIESDNYKLNLSVNDLLDKVFYNIPLGEHTKANKMGKRKLAKQEEKYHIDIPNLTMYFTHHKQLGEI
jgi:hypothetical protein